MTKENQAFIKTVKTEELRSTLAQTGWDMFAERVSLSEGEELRDAIKLELFHRHPHHRCDTCHKPMSEISGPRCSACINLTLRMPR
jgi:hypothetical protein